jgi:hypothetical protein
MKWVLRVLAVLLILTGIVWILQGVNVLGGSMMSGHIQYAILGIVTGVIGGGLWYLSNRRPRPL